MGLMEKFSDPELITSLGFGEKMAGSAVTMLMGMGITFCVLLLLWGFISVMGKAMNTGKKNSKAQPQAATVTPAVAPAPATAPKAESDDTLIAVLTAAVAAYEEDMSSRNSCVPGNLTVRKIARDSGDMAPWMNVARKESMSGRKYWQNTAQPGVDRRQTDK